LIDGVASPGQKPISKGNWLGELCHIHGTEFVLQCFPKTLIVVVSAALYSCKHIFGA
jgi:hypothetical protein